jgi:6-phosphogluconate dehydrogenase
MKYSIGVVGLGVMGHNLALNMQRNGFPLAGYDLDPTRTEAFLDSSGNDKDITGVNSPAKLMAILEKPRRILIMVPAGAPVDRTIERFKPYLEYGDLLIDGGNSFFMDTERRNKSLEKKGFNFIGMGVSGGEEGALWGPSIMPGGQFEAWESISDIFRAISAKASDGQPCVEYMGPRGAGHYVKMIHNGIEYSDMQLIAEIYDILHRGLGMPASEMADLFEEWNCGKLKSYLIEITAVILRHIDPETGLPLVDLILDEAQQKGTGKWTSQNALDMGAPIPAINAAVESRFLSSLKSQRVIASKIIFGPPFLFKGNQTELIKAAEAALFASKIVSYAQGFGMLQIASQEYEYDLKLCEIAKIWRGGCIIRANLLEDITTAYKRNPMLINILFDETFRTAVESRQTDWRKVVQTAIDLGIPTMGLSTSLAYFDAFRSERLPANLTQAQRDYFGAHTYKRTDKDGVFHTSWQ